MKKLLLLGGSDQQIIAINTAKELGYHTVLCDYLTDNPGQYAADTFYLVSTTDKEAILEVAKKESIDGILAYASDPAAPTAAYVAEQLGLPSNPYKAVQTLCNKDMFRIFLRENGFNTPESNGYTDADTALSELDKYELPVIIKPVDSSGSKGVTVLRSWEKVNEALDFAFSFSRAHKLIIEEFIEKKHPYLIGGDVFIKDGKVILYGLLNCHRDGEVNPLVPVGKSFPLMLSDEDVKEVRNCIQKMVTGLGINFGSMNVELVMDKNNRVWPIDVGPRAGGNMIPDLLGMVFKTDLVKMAVLSAMGCEALYDEHEGEGMYATHNLHSSRNGIYEDILFSEKLEKYIIKKCFYKKAGDRVEYFDNAAKALGIIFMKFDDPEEMKDILQNINDHISIILK